MSFAEEYQQKLTTAQEAAAAVRSGYWVDYGWCVATPQAIDEALAARAGELEDVNLRGGILIRIPEIFKVPEPEKHFTWNSWHMSGIERHAVNSGLAYYVPIRYSELPRYYRENVERVDVAFFQVAPMDCLLYTSRCV